jgi:four helix bundle protein
MNIRSYQELKVWQKSMDLVVSCYGVCKTFPTVEKYGLTSQLQRAAVSIPANIAEGKHRQHTKEFLQHLSIASGSLAELETHLLIAERLNYISKQEIFSLLEQTTEISKMIFGLRKSLKQKLGTRD